MARFPGRRATGERSQGAHRARCPGQAAASRLPWIRLAERRAARGIPDPCARLVLSEPVPGGQSGCGAFVACRRIHARGEIRCAQARQAAWFEKVRLWLLRSGSPVPKEKSATCLHSSPNHLTGANDAGRHLLGADRTKRCSRLFSKSWTCFVLSAKHATHLET